MRCYLDIKSWSFPLGGQRQAELTLVIVDVFLFDNHALVIILEGVFQFFKMFCSEHKLDCWKILHVGLSMWKK